MKIEKYLIILILLGNFNFAYSINITNSFIKIDRCTNINLANEAPYLIPPDIKKFRHYRNVILSNLFKPFHVVHDLILSEHHPAVLHAKFDYDWVLHKDLEDEYIHTYLYADHTKQWRYLGKFKTDLNGEVFIPLNQRLTPGDYLVRMFVEGDGSSADGLISIINPKHQAIVFDIDGTLTLSDFEIVKDFLSLSIAAPYYYAAEVLDAYKQKGYEIIFLTARPYWMASVSREWLENILFYPPWPLKTRNSLLLRESTAQFKGNYLKDLIKEKQLNIIRAYGNAMTDIEAYELAGIPKKDTFIIGPNAGKKGTTPIKQNYFNHFYEIVAPTPLASCKNN
ncbi:LNS2 domain-containing protein [Legionella sp. CNM-1927-20]|uniref:LNS2 domain-containing protein n=1 Tax=Legionella sp. CNM-1927-20 TaxID=3422221 RepID=UPI00403AF45F